MPRLPRPSGGFEGLLLGLGDRNPRVGFWSGKYAFREMTAEDTESPEDRPGRLLTRRMVQLHKEFYGRGPTKAKAYFQDDSIMVMMRGGFTAVEKTLLQAGRGESVAQQRRDFQDVMRERFSEMVAEVTGRKVVAFMNTSHQDPDLICNIFLLENTDLLEPPTDPVP